MNVYLILATANHNEVDGQVRFIHKRAFRTKTNADKFSPIFKREIQHDNSGPLTFCNVEVRVEEIELVD